MKAILANTNALRRLLNQMDKVMEGENPDISYLKGRVAISLEFVSTLEDQINVVSEVFEKLGTKSNKE